MKRLALVLAWSLVLVPCTRAPAAGTSRSQSSWRWNGARVEGWVWCDASSLESFASAAERGESPRLGAWIAADHVRERISVWAGDERCDREEPAPDAVPTADGGLRIPMAFRCPRAADRLELEIDAFFERRLGHVHVVRVHADGRLVAERALHGGVRSVVAWRKSGPAS